MPRAVSAAQTLIDDGTLARLMEILSRHRLGLCDAEPDILERAYEYLLRMFNQASALSMKEQEPLDGRYL